MKKEKEKWEGRNFSETGSQECGSRIEREFYMKDQHPSREEMA
jgi:hypothetical protein